MMTVQTTFFPLSSFESSPCQKRLDQGVLQVLYVKNQCPWLQWILINTAASWEIYYVVRLKDLVSFGCFSGGDFGAAIWRIPERGQGGNRVIPLQNVVNLQGHTVLMGFFYINSTLWWPSGKHNQLVSIDAENLYLWDIDTSLKTAQVVPNKRISYF
jgi:hypothetical protein